MSGRPTEYEIFLSYSRPDNAPIPASAAQGWVTALRDQIIEDHRRFSTAPLRIFFDTDEIKDMDDWRQRILLALRHSKILLVCLSPAYFRSQYCRWEWEEYLRRQVHHLMGSESIATIYFVEVPGCAERDSAHWLESLTRGNFTDIRPWFPAGATSLQRQDVRERMAKLGESLWERIKRARRALGAPGNLRQSNPYFLGRNEELRQLHENLALGAVGMVTAVHGLGGQGKTELAVAYAHAYADHYGAGLWVLPAEGKQGLLPLIGELAYAPELGYRPTDAERNDPALLGRAVLAELQRRSAAAVEKDPHAGAAALLILDNVSEAQLLSPAELATLPRADWLRLVATTRLGRDQLPAPRQALAFVQVDSLRENDALALMRDHQPPRDRAGLAPGFVSPVEEAAARAIVRELGGFTLAIEQVAVYLGLHPEIPPSGFLAGLRAKGLADVDRVGARADVGAQMRHQQKQLSLVLDATLGLLDPAGLTALRFAGLLPPDAVPWEWLKTLTLRRHPELRQVEAGQPDPWLVTRRRLEGLRLLTEGDAPELARVHRLVAAHLGQSTAPELGEEVQEHVASRALDFSGTQAVPAPWELDALLVAAPAFLNRAEPDRRLANAAVMLSDKAGDYRNLSVAMALLRPAHDFLRQAAASDPANAAWQGDLLVAHQRMGDALLTQGNVAGALEEYRGLLTIARDRVNQNPGDAQEQHNLSISHTRVGNVLLMQGDTAGALGEYQVSLAIAERLVAQEPFNAGWQHNLASSHDSVGVVLMRRGDAAGALAKYRASLAIAELHAALDPANVGWQSALSSSHANAGDVLLVQGDAGAALGEYQAALALRERLAAGDPASAAGQRNLSAAYRSVGDVLQDQGDLDGALQTFREDLAVMRRLTAKDPTNANLQETLWGSYDKLGNLLLGQGDAAGALTEYQASLVIAERLASQNPTNVDWQRNLLVSLQRVGDMLLTRGEAAGALANYQTFMAIAQRLATQDPTNAQWQDDLAVSHNRSASALMLTGKKVDALRSFWSAHRAYGRLHKLDPTNQRWQYVWRNSFIFLVGGIGAFWTARLALAAASVAGLAMLPWPAKWLAVLMCLASLLIVGLGWLVSFAMRNQAVCGRWANRLRAFAFSDDLDNSRKALHFSKAIRLCTQAQLLQSQEDFAQAEAAFRAALEVWRQTRPAGHVDIASCLSNLAALLETQGRRAEAEPMLRESLEIWRKALPAGHPHIATSLSNLGDMVWGQGRGAQAEPMFREAMDIRRQSLPAGSWDTLSSLRSLEGVLQVQGKAKDEATLRASVDVIRQSLPAGNSDLALALNELASLLQSQGRPGEAEPLFREVLDIRRQTLPAGDTDIALAIDNLALALQDQGKLDEAFLLQRESLEIRQPACGPNQGGSGEEPTRGVREHPGEGGHDELPRNAGAAFGPDDRVATQMDMKAADGTLIPAKTFGDVLALGRITPQDGQHYLVKWDGITIPQGEEIAEKYLMPIVEPRKTEPPPPATTADKPRVGRNDPCPCGSGIRYKHCHGRSG
jgi:tetratricopeptide (TPR) repeat protein